MLLLAISTRWKDQNENNNVLDYPMNNLDRFTLVP